MKKLLIVVDYQNDFVDGTLGFEGAKLLEKGICDKIREYENNEVIYTLDTHMEDYANTYEGRHLPVAHCVKGTKGHELYGGVKELLADKRCFEKNTFPSLDMANYLAGGGYDVIELCGLVSSICVLSNAVMARSACPDAEIIVNKNLTAAADKTMHEKAMDILKNIFVQVYE